MIKWLKFCTAMFIASTNLVFAETCAPGDVLYIAVDPVREPLGLREESRAQYLQRVYGEGVTSDNAVIQFVPPPSDSEDVVHVQVTAPAETALERADFIVESRIDFIDGAGQRTERFGHREIGRYALQSDGRNEISVPRTVLREPGALLVVVTMRTKSEDRRKTVADAYPVDLPACPHRVYTQDRFTAIRLNRARTP